MDINLKDKWALVCGASQGIGFETAREMANSGASVTLCARNEESLRTAVAQLSTDNGQQHDYIVADFSTPSVLEASLDAHLAKRSNPYHILVNNTGGPPAGLAHEAEIEHFRSAFELHLICNHILATRLIPGMKDAGYGRIINVISTSVKQPLPNLGVSNTIRGAVANWAKTLANELGQFNITVNNVLPGATNTARLKSIVSNKASKTGQEEQKVLEGMANQVPMKRVGEPEEVAGAITFLASPSAGYINGVNLPVDGGRTSSL